MITIKDFMITIINPSTYITRYNIHLKSCPNCNFNFANTSWLTLRLFRLRLLRLTLLRLRFFRLSTIIQIISRWQVYDRSFHRLLESFLHNLESLLNFISHHKLQAEINITLEAYNKDNQSSKKHILPVPFTKDFI